MQLPCVSPSEANFIQEVVTDVLILMHSQGEHIPAVPAPCLGKCCAILPVPRCHLKGLGPGADLTSWTATTSQWQKHSSPLNCFYLFSPNVSIRKKLLHTPAYVCCFLGNSGENVFFSFQRMQNKAGAPQVFVKWCFSNILTALGAQRTETSTIPCRALMGWLAVCDSTYFSVAPFNWSVPSSCILCPVHLPTQEVSEWPSNCL